jgi:hypothetical protein
MAYARQMLANGTLIPDHTAFSWTPTDNVIIYCAWLTQLPLYGLHQLGGLPALFGLRYGLFLAVLGGVVAYARHVGTARHPLTWFLAIVALSCRPRRSSSSPTWPRTVFMSATVLSGSARHRGDSLAMGDLPPVLMAFG